MKGGFGAVLDVISEQVMAVRHFQSLLKTRHGPKPNNKVGKSDAEDG
jgi:hypothetical protein